MTIVAISDTHGRHTQLDMAQYPGDVLIHAGDWTKGRDLGLSETKEFFHWFGKQPYKYKICIAGNHEVEVEASSTLYIENLAAANHCTYLYNNYIMVEGLKIYGSPYSNEFFNWAFMDDELNLEAIWELIPKDTNILITHGPAYSCHDYVNNAYNLDPNVGSQSLADRKKELEGTLKAHICGHIHEGHGTSTTNGCFNVNASVLNEKYELVNTPTVFEV